MSVPFSKSLLAVTVTAAIAFAASGPAMAAGTHAEELGHGHDDTQAFGEAGKPSEASRTIEIVMGDNYFEPEKIAVQPGETIRFVVKNEGGFLHEFNIGTAATHAEHQKEMTTMMEHGMLTATGVDHDAMKMDHSSKGMAGHVHDDPNSVLVEPGKTQELVWTFAAATDLEFACNVPGHYETGMMGEIDMKAGQNVGS